MEKKKQVKILLLCYFINKQLHYQITITTKMYKYPRQQVWMDVTLHKMAEISKRWTEIYFHMSKFIKAT